MYSPNDIREFWEGTRAALDKIPMQPELSPAPEQSGQRVRHLWRDADQFWRHQTPGLVLGAEG